MNKAITSFIFILLIIITTVSGDKLFAEEIHIPVDYPTIQQGINAAANGDSVIVAPGMWYEHLTIAGKNIILGSWFLTTGDTAYIRETNLNGSNTGRVITVSDAGAGTRISGFTARNGSSADGGAIHVVNSNLQIDHVEILNNTSECGSIQHSYGGGIACHESTLLLSDFTFSNNRALCSTLPETPLGGALYAGYSELHLFRGKFQNNYGDLGGGACLSNCNTLIQQVEFKSNEVSWFGGGICVLGGELSIVESTLRENQGGGGVFSTYEGSLDIQNCLFADNERCSVQNWDMVLTITNSTFTGKGSYDHLLIDLAETRIINSVFWGQADAELHFSGGQPSDLYLINSLVKNGASGITGNVIKHITGPLLSENPLFADTISYQLSDNSPCIGAGLDSLDSYPNISAPDIDLYLNPRPNPAGSPPDLGAIEHELGSPVTGIYLPESDESTISIYQYERGLFRIKGIDIETIAVYSSSGKMVYFSDNLNAGQVEVKLQTSPGGIYLFSILLNNHQRVVRKVVVF